MNVRSIEPVIVKLQTQIENLRNTYLTNYFFLGQANTKWSTIPTLAGRYPNLADEQLALKEREILDAFQRAHTGK
jgi:hypothetical protein